MELRLVRSLLFVPASNPRLIDKARGLDADMVILDLEDAVAEPDKPTARAAAVEACRAFAGRPTAIRVNAIGSAWHDEDLAAVAASGADFLVLPKAESGDAVLAAGTKAGKAVISMIETPRGVLAIDTIAGHSAALLAGTNDLAATLGLPPGAGRSGLVYALQRLVLAARAAGIPTFDGVHAGLEDEEALALEAREGRAFGFDGKSVIHPSQIAAVNATFAPAQAEIEAALRLIAAAGDGARRHEGHMIEDLHVEQAKCLLAKAKR